MRVEPGDAPIIVVAGEIDIDNRADLTRQVTDLLEQASAARVGLDLGDLTYVGSAGIRALLTCREVAQQLGIRLEVCRIHENALQVLTVCGLTEEFHLPAAGTPDKRDRYALPWS
jgi:anti-anti-sigma factor